MTPRRDRWGEPIDDEPPYPPERRRCWRCARDLNSSGPVPVCDGCATATRQRIEARDRRSSVARRGRADVRPRDIDALRRHAYRAAVELGQLTPRPIYRRWWEA